MIDPATKIDGLALRTKTQIILRDEQLLTIADIRAAGRSYLLGCRNCGPIIVREIEDAIGGWGVASDAEIAAATEDYKQAYSRYQRAQAALIAAKAVLERMHNPPPQKGRTTAVPQPQAATP